MTRRTSSSEPPITITPIVIYCHRDARDFYLITHSPRADANELLSRQSTCHLCGAPLVIVEQEPLPWVRRRI